MSQPPLDADAVLRDDALLDSLGRGELPSEFDEDATIKLLHAWRNDVAHAAGLPDDALATVGAPALHDQAPAPVLLERRSRLRRPVLVAAAVGAIAVASMGSVAAAGVAEPGSPLWPITKVVYSDRAESLEAREDALSLLRDAKRAAARNQPEEARRLLITAMEEADRVDGKKDQDKIQDQVAEVKAEIAAIDEPSPGVTTPSTPPQSPATPEPIPVPQNPPPTTEPTVPPVETTPPAEPPPSTPAEPTPSPSLEPTPTPSLGDGVGPTGLTTSAPAGP
jgi:hypothetical protein